MRAAGANTASGQSRQTHGLAGQGLPLGPCSPDSWSAQAAVNTSRCPPTSSASTASSSSSAGDQLRVAAGQGGGVLLGDHRRRLRPAQPGHAGRPRRWRRRLALRRGRGGQVVVAFDLRAVVGVDGRPAAPRPAVLVPHRLDAWCGSGDRCIFSGPPSSLITPSRASQRWTAVAGATGPAATFGMPAAAQPQPQLAAVGRVGVAAQQPGVRPATAPAAAPPGVGRFRLSAAVRPLT